MLFSFSPSSSSHKEHNNLNLKNEKVFANGKCGMSGREIERNINRSKADFYNLLQNTKDYGKKEVYR